MVRNVRGGAAAAMLVALAGCGPNYSPNTYASAAVQQANPTQRGVVVGVRKVGVSADATLGTVTGAAAGGIAGAGVDGGDGAITALSALGGSVIGGVVGSGVEHATGDTTAYEYIVQETKGDLVSVTQRDTVPLAIGQKVLVIAGKQARVVADYTITMPEPPPAPKTADKAGAPGAPPGGASGASLAAPPGAPSGVPSGGAPSGAPSGVPRGTSPASSASSGAAPPAASPGGSPPTAATSLPSTSAPAASAPSASDAPEVRLDSAGGERGGSRGVGPCRGCPGRDAPGERLVARGRGRAAGRGGYPNGSTGRAGVAGVPHCPCTCAREPNAMTSGAAAPAGTGAALNLAS